MQPDAPATPQAHTHATPEDSAMAETTRADALRGLIERTEEGFPHGGPFIEGSLIDQTDAARLHRQDVWAAMSGSLDAVARLEAPLRERGWFDTVLSPRPWRDGWMATFSRPFPSRTDCLSTATTEARARLLAVLRAHLHEEEAR